VELDHEETHDDNSFGFVPVKTAVGCGGENVGRESVGTRIGATDFKDDSEVPTYTLYPIKSIPPRSSGGAHATCTKVLPIGNSVASRYNENADRDVKARVESCEEKKLVTDASAAITGVLTNTGAEPTVVTPTADAKTKPAGLMIELFCPSPALL